MVTVRAIRLGERIILNRVIVFVHVMLRDLVGRNRLNCTMSQTTVIFIVTSLRTIMLG
jgi:hypothetical protein